MLLVGDFERVDSERGIAWRCADSLGLRSFLGISLTEATPDHSGLSVIRRGLNVETHQKIFRWVLSTLESEGLLKGKTLGVDATTVEANAALRSMVRHDTGEGYTEFLTCLGEASGIENAQREDLAKRDRNRRKKGSNSERRSPSDPDVRITKMKDGRTHLAHKAEHAVDLETGAVVSVSLHPADVAETQMLLPSLADAAQNLAEATQAAQTSTEVVADKGYHSNETASALAQAGIRTYLSEPTGRI